VYFYIDSTSKKEYSINVAGERKADQKRDGNMREMYTMFNYFKRESAAVLFDGIGYRFRIGNFISLRYETEKGVVQALVKREYYLN
jgi:hypothetical protein